LMMLWDSLSSNIISASGRRVRFGWVREWLAISCPCDASSRQSSQETSVALVVTKKVPLMLLALRRGAALSTCE
jgi:hypothetical protein